MADTKTWIEVADSAIKIGLGAVIGGGASILLSWLTYRRESKKGYWERRRKLIEQSVSDFNTFSKILSRFWAALRNAVDHRDGGRELSAKGSEALRTLEKDLHNAFADLVDVRGALLLIGEQQAAQSLEDFAKDASAFFKIADLKHEGCTATALDDFRTRAESMRKEFYEYLHRAYKLDS